MIPSAILGDMFARSTLTDLAHSALPNAPIQPVRPTGRATRLARSLRHRSASGTRRRGVAPVTVVSSVVAESPAR
jgi:hypothetical protein